MILLTLSRVVGTLFAAKNVILAGVKAVTLHDTGAVALEDLSAQFYLTESNVGANRAEACAAKLQELNPAVAVIVVTDEISDALLAQHQVCAPTHARQYPRDPPASRQSRHCTPPLPQGF